MQYLSFYDESNEIKKSGMKTVLKMISYEVVARF